MRFPYHIAVLVPRSEIRLGIILGREDCEPIVEAQKTISLLVHFIPLTPKKAGLREFWEQIISLLLIADFYN